MAEWPRANTTIVVVLNVKDIQEIRNDAIWRFESLLPNLPTVETELWWCARHHLIRNSMPCGGCQQPCNLIRYAQEIDGCRWWMSLRKLGCFPNVNLNDNLAQAVPYFHLIYRYTNLFLVIVFLLQELFQQLRRMIGRELSLICF